MKIFELDGTKMTTRADAHDYLQKALELPSYYGKNLDALYDCLQEMYPCKIHLYHPEALEAMGEYGEMLLEVLNTVEFSEE